MKLVSLKMGRPYRIWEAVHQTCHPWDVLIPQGSAVREADGRIWSSDYPVVGLFWPQAYYQVFLLLKECTTEYYCNIISPVQYQSGVQKSIVFEDLEIDVLVGEGGPRVVDMEEFVKLEESLKEDGSVLQRYGYEVEWRSNALAARDTLVTLATNRSGPFSPATEAWWRAYVNRRIRNP